MTTGITEPFDPLAEALREALGPAYDIESELSGGGMSRVFVATERALNRKVVVKVLPPDVAAGVNRERFRREIQLAAQLQHPHIVPLLSAGDTGGLLYYTMPFIEGESLKHALAHGTRFSPREVIGILLDIVDALAYAHARGVIHRDVKPANVLRSGVHAVVADFGVAKALSASLPAVGMTTSGMAIGTPQYMAPEQLAGDPAADHRMDIYAVGLLGYELLTGAPTFAEQSPQATLAAQLTRNPEPLDVRRPDVPDPLARLLMRCLAKDPGSRPATAQAVRTELEEIVMPSGDYPPRRDRRRQRPWLGAAAASVGGIALVAVLAMLAQRDGETAATVDSPSVATPTPPPPAPVAVSPPDTSTPRPPMNTATSTRSTAAGDSSGRRSAAPPPPRAGSGTGRRTAGGPRTSADSLADLVMLLRAQAPPDPIVRPPSPNSVSQAALEERRNNMGPKRKVLLVADSDSVSRAVMTRVGQLLDRDRYDVSTSPLERATTSQEALDSLATAGGHDLYIAMTSPLRRDSSYAANARLRDLTAHASYANSGASRRITRDSVGVGADSLASQIIRRVTSMDRAPRLGAVDPEIRAFDERARDMGPPRRVVIWNHPPHENLAVQEAGSAVMDVLRTTLRNFPRFTQVPRDSTLDLLARSRNRETVLSALKADFMVSIAASFSSDSVSWLISVRDATAAPQFQERSFRSAAAPISSPFAFVATTLSRVIAAMEQMDAAPRRPVSR